MKTPAVCLPRVGPCAVRRSPRLAAILTVVILQALIASCAVPSGMTRRHPAAPSDIERYIARGWEALTRHPLNCGALVDPKVPQGQSLLYIPAQEPITPAMRKAAADCGVGIRQLAPQQRVGTQVVELDRQGLLFVPHAYVVPGGRFNEMYGWDSYFIVEGLVADGRAPLARGMTENFFYQLDHYGAILNANRTYYLTRSQPPFLTSMIKAVGRALEPSSRRPWIQRGYAAAQKDWAFWDRPELRAGDTGLTRYFDFGRGPVPEMQDDPTYYQMVMEKLLGMGQAGAPYVRAVSGTVPAGEPSLRQGDRVYVLTEDFYQGDRAMRASGYDISFRFGPYGAATHHYAPVCLNALLYRQEMDLADMAEELGRSAEADTWRDRADARKAAMMRFLWDDRQGLFLDYDFVAARRSDYLYATTFFPLWAGLVTPDHARRLAGHLDAFLQPGGIAMSTRQTGVQWDMPFGWAPVQLLTIEGLRHYGFTRQADDAAQRWLRMVVENFRREGTLREKYNVVTRSADVQVEIGYAANVIGFGWTNAVFIKLLQSLPPQAQMRVLSP